MPGPMQSYLSAIYLCSYCFVVRSFVLLFVRCYYFYFVDCKYSIFVSESITVKSCEYTHSRLFGIIFFLLLLLLLLIYCCCIYSVILCFCCCVCCIERCAQCTRTHYMPFLHFPHNRSPMRFMESLTVHVWPTPFYHIYGRPLSTIHCAMLLFFTPFCFSPSILS